MIIYFSSYSNAFWVFLLLWPYFAIIIMQVYILTLTGYSAEADINNYITSYVLIHSSLLIKQWLKKAWVPIYNVHYISVHDAWHHFNCKQKIISIAGCKCLCITKQRNLEGTFSEYAPEKKNHQENTWAGHLTCF